MKPRFRTTVLPLAAGLLVGLMCLAQAGGWFMWMPESLFMLLHLPAFWLSGLVFPGERVLLGMPVAIVGQWLLVGWGVGWMVAKVRSAAQPPGAGPGSARAESDR